MYPHHLAEEAKKEAQSVPSVADKVGSITLATFSHNRVGLSLEVEVLTGEGGRKLTLLPMT